LSISRFLGTAAFLASLAVPATALAQQAPPPAAATFTPGARAQHGHRHGGFRKALRSLNLTPAQQTQIDQAFAQTRQANQNADKTARKANRKQLRSRIEAILTPAQRAQLKAALQRNHRPA
jgi:Spy/CpxP family protein refolding chaperone